MQKYVLVTGGHGFIGGDFIRRMTVKHPDDIFINVDDLRIGAFFDIANINTSYRHNYRYHKIALEDAEAVNHIFETYPITDVIHFAAETDVDRSLRSPIDTATSNIMGTINLLEASVHKAKDVRFVYVSTDEVYGDVSDDNGGSIESDAHRPSSPYSAAKSAAEGFVVAYERSHNLDAVITRGCNTFGEWQDYTKLIPVAMRHLRNNEKIPVYGDGEQIREWMPVERHTSGIEYVWKHGITGEAYNIGKGIRLCNLALLQLLCTAVDVEFNETRYHFVADRKGHDRSYAINTDKIHDLGWNTKQQDMFVVLDRIQETARWYYNSTI